MKTINRVIIMIIGALLTLSGQNIVSSVHNLSASGPGSVKATTESEICIFCHTPHNSSSRQPLWNKKDPVDGYTLYSSSTQQSTSQTPDGGSLLCLSCHDGTIALGEVLSRTEIIAFAGGITVMPSGPTDLTQFLADDHPITIVYDAALAAADAELADPSTLTGPVKVKNGKVQCTSCHDPHDNLLGDFLVESTQYSQLCTHCHQKSGWSTASHKNSTATWNGSGNDPWFHTDYNTVAENACENCHKPHSAGNQLRLTNYYNEEDNCLDCHNGNVASTDIQSDINQTYSHDVYANVDVHDPTENIPVQTQHAECVDCHNPHAANGNTASAPDAPGSIQGVPGVDSDGNAVNAIQYEYELCYKCHADSPNKPAPAVTRQIVQSNVRLEFEPANPSFHPIEAQGQNNDVPSLLPPYTESSIIYCTDCHASSGASAASGPHGSVNVHLLKYNYETADYTPESYSAYELCYQCHDRDKIINDPSNFGQDVHNTHIVGEDAPCSACHDPHGISNTQGNSTNNSHLINFDTDIVQSRSGLLEFVDTGNFSGYCNLRCHGKGHRNKSY